LTTHAARRLRYHAAVTIQGEHGRDVPRARHLLASLAALTLAACSALVSFDDLSFATGAGGAATSGAGGMPFDTCNGPEECPSGHCVDGVCCAEECTTCSACNVAGAEGTCAALPSGAEDDGCEGRCDGQGTCVNGAPLWALAIGDRNDQLLRSLTVDGDGNTIIAGVFTGIVDFGGGLRATETNDGFVAKYDPEGTYLFDRVIDGNGGDDILHDVAVNAAGEIVAVGNFTQSFELDGFELMAPAPGIATAMVVRLEPGGGTLGAFTPGVPDQGAIEVALSPAGRIYVAGTYGGGFSYCGAVVQNAGGRDVFLGAFETSGACTAFRTLGGDAFDQPNDLVADGSGAVVMVGGTSSTEIGLASTMHVGQGGTDGFVVGFEGGELEPRWAGTVGTRGEDSIVGVALDGRDVLVAGSYSGTCLIGGLRLAPPVGGPDGFIARLTIEGQGVWGATFGGTGFDEIRGIASDADKNLVLSGVSDGTTVDFGGGALTGGGDLDLVVAKLTAGGAHVWSARYGTSDSQSTPGAHALAPDGRLVIGASFRGTIPMGGEVYESANVGDELTDLFVASFSP
jgi:hypothetical protein